MQRELRLLSFNINKLFGEFDHSIPLDQQRNVTALIGPNGLGKTVCLRLINALFRKQWSVFSATDFESIEYQFSNGARVVVTHSSEENQTDQVSETMGVRFETFAGNDSERWSPRLAENPLRLNRLEYHIPEVTRSGPRTWMVDATGQSLSLQELVENYSHQLPKKMLQALNASPSPLLSDLISQIDCHLIETQRLLVLQPDEDSRRRRSSTWAISKKAETLRMIISEELARYGSTSQSLDRSFPRRVVAQGPVAADESLSQSLQELDELRQGLTDAGILDSEADESLSPDIEVDPATATVLKVYVSDTRQKLDVLRMLQSRILLFIELINDRFSPKAVEVGKEFGFAVKRHTDVPIPLEKLSSGEQHQLVLFFELLFELKKNALILIDEPELSLHVGWQKKFITDLERIIDLNEFDVLLATHSPQLIGEWEEIVVELGDVGK